MEVVIFVAMMIVPVFSVVSLVLSLLNKRRTDALKNVVLRYCAEPDSPKQALEMLEL